MFFFEGDREIEILVNRYETGMRNNNNFFFDVSDFENIINYYLSLDNLNKALGAIKIASKQHPQSTSLKIKKAHLFVERGQPLRSIKILREIESLETGNPEFYMMKGTAYSLLGDISVALKNYNKAVDSDIDNEEEILYGIALTLQNQNLYKESVNFIKRALNKNPENSRYIFLLGYTYEKTGNLEKSIKLFKNYLEENPFSESAWFNLGIKYYKINKLNEALEALDFVLAINEENFVALFHKANILSDKGDFEKALQVYLDYIETEPDAIEGFIGVAYCYEQLGVFSLARKYYRKAISEEPEFSESWYGLASVAYEEDKFEESIINLKKAVELEPENSEYHIFLAQIFDITGKVTESYDAYKTALDVDPGKVEYFEEMVEMLLKKRLWKKAIREIDYHLNNNQFNDRKYCYMAVAKFGTGNEISGLYYLEKALKLNPGIISTFYTYYEEGKNNKQIEKLIIRTKK